MNHLLEVINHPAQAFKTEKKTLAWILVLITVFINSILEPIFQYVASSGTSKINIENIIRTTVLGILCYIIVCLALWLVGRVFKSRTKLSNYIGTWGMTYIPTLICSIAVMITESKCSIFWDNILWGMFFSIVFMGILFWKIILLITYLEEVVKLKKWSLAGAFLVMVVIIAVLAALCGYVGVKTPVI